MKQEKQYEIVLHVGSTQLTTVLDVVRESATIASVKQLDITKAPRRTAVRIKGSNSTTVLLNELSDGKIHTDEDLAKVLVRLGLSAATVHPTMSGLCRAGKAKRVARGRYCLPTVTHLLGGSK